MQGVVKRLISKLKYINRLIISTSEESQKILARQCDTETAVRDVQNALNDIRKEIEYQKQVQEQIRAFTEKAQQNYNASIDYVNLEYLYLLNNTDKKILLWAHDTSLVRPLRKKAQTSGSGKPRCLTSPARTERLRLSQKTRVAPFRGNPRRNQLLK